MGTTIRIAVLGLSLSALLGSAGCGAAPCGRASKCAADPKPTEADVKACQEQEKTNASDPCNAAAKALGDCAYANTVCAKDNTTDPTASADKYNTACTSQQAALTACCEKNTNSALCGGTF